MCRLRGGRVCVWGGGNTLPNARRKWQKLLEKYQLIGQIGILIVWFLITFLFLDRKKKHSGQLTYDLVNKISNLKSLYNNYAFLTNKWDNTFFDLQNISFYLFIPINCHKLTNFLIYKMTRVGQKLGNKAKVGQKLHWRCFAENISKNSY